VSIWISKPTGRYEKIDVCGDDEGRGKADKNSQEEADGAADHGGVEVLEGIGGMIQPGGYGLRIAIIGLKPQRRQQIGNSSQFID
jgi:hypothetical protein